MNADRHLSEEALDDFLIGMGTPEAKNHLAHCAACRARIGEFREALDWLDQSSMAWSRQRAAGLDAMPARRGTHLFSLATMGYVMVAVLLAVVAFPVWHNQNRAKSTPVQQPAMIEDNSETQIAQDNELLRAVDAALNTNVTLPFADASHSSKPHRLAAAQPE